MSFRVLDGAIEWDGVAVAPICERATPTVLDAAIQALQTYDEDVALADDVDDLRKRNEDLEERVEQLESEITRRDRLIAEPLAERRTAKALGPL